MSKDAHNGYNEFVLSNLKLMKSKQAGGLARLILKSEQILSKKGSSPTFYLSYDPFHGRFNEFFKGRLNPPENQREQFAIGLAQIHVLPDKYWVEIFRGDPQFQHTQLSYDVISETFRVFNHFGNKEPPIIQVYL